MLTIRNLTIVHKKDLTALIENLSFSVSPGERIAVIGEEGNGKSTLLRAIAGDDAISAYAEISGQIVNSFSFGFLPQELPSDKRQMTAYEYFCESDAFFDQTPGDLGALASRLRIPSDVFYSEQRMGDFSGGERVKLQLARLLLASPQLLLLDEPSNDLDMDTVRWLEEFLVSCGLESISLIFQPSDRGLILPLGLCGFVCRSGLVIAQLILVCYLAVAICFHLLEFGVGMGRRRHPQDNRES